MEYESVHARRLGKYARESFLRYVLFLALALALAACPAGEEPVVEPEEPVAEPEEPVAEPEEPVEEWEREWDELVAAAQEEGRLTVYTPQDPVIRTDVSDVFGEKFGIEVETTPVIGPQVTPRIRAERAAGEYTVDIFISGNVSLYNWYQEGWLDPIAPLLFHPEATDPDVWDCVSCDLTGPYPFIDPNNEAIMRLVNFREPNIIYNTDIVDRSELRTWQDLLDPQFRGQIGTYDPIDSPPGRFSARFLWKALGDDFVRALFQEQQPRLTDQTRVLEDGLIRGTTPIVLVLTPSEIEELRSQGHPVDVVDELGGALEGFSGYVFSSGFMVSYINQAPNPNAAKLFLNWLASKEGAETYARALRLPSTRSDLTNDWAPTYAVPDPQREYLDLQSWEQSAQLQDPEELAQLSALVGRE